MTAGRVFAWRLAPAVAYLALCAALFFFQRSLIYFPQPRAVGIGADPVVLVTPYHSILELARQRFPWAPVRWLLQDKYESWRHAPQVTAPTLLIAAARLVLRLNAEPHQRAGSASGSLIWNVNPACACRRSISARPIAAPGVQTPPGVWLRSCRSARHSAASLTILAVEP